MEKIERLISGLRKSGYDIILFFLWLPSAEMAVARVASRVRQGGHDVPAATIRRRFQAGLRNLFQLYAPFVNSWYLLDGSHLPPSLIANRSDGALQTRQPELFQMIQTPWGN
jgi:predicted ABC-type ATPase